MYKLIIVDDEKVIRRGIRDYFDWAGMNFEVVALFEDGREAIDYLSKETVDVILTDIEMAEVSGLELAQYIHDNAMPQKVVIISGYKEFEYARKAVQYGVEYYLLKPIKMEEVTEVFTKISKDLGRARDNQSETKMKEILPELIEQFWISMLMGGPRARGTLKKRLQMISLSIDEAGPYALLDLEFMEKDEEFEMHYEGENYRNLIHNVCGGERDGIRYFPVCLSSDMVKVVAVSGQSETAEVFKKRLTAQIEEKCETVLGLLKLKINLTVEQLFADIYAITEYQCVLRRDTGLTEDKVEIRPEDYERFMEKYKLIMGTINDGDFEELDYLIDTIFHEFWTMPDQQVKHLCIDMFSMLGGRMIKMGLDPWGGRGEQVSYQSIMSARNRRELKKITKERMDNIISQVKEKRNFNSKNFVEEAVKYLKGHFSEEISLEYMAGKVFLNQAYFSRLFKQYTGVTFTDYLIELRMEKAKELLSQGSYKVYEVSRLVGYKNEKYFFRIFKQYAGCSPSEYYRGKCLNEEK